MRVFALDFAELRDGTRTLEVEFPAEVPASCSSRRCAWDFDAAPGGDPAGGAATDYLVMTQTSRGLMTMGVVDGVEVATVATFDAAGELMDVQRTSDQAPGRWTGEARLGDVETMMNDLQELLGYAGMNEPQAAGLGCKLGKVAGWVAVGAAVAGCCAVGNVPGCVLCGGLGGGAAGLIGELC